MEKWQEKHLPSRKAQTTHKSWIENAYLSKTIPDKHFRRICRKVFTLHSIESPLLSKPQWPIASEFSKSSLPIGLDDWLNHQFHSNHYKTPETLIKGISLDGGKVQVENDFLDRLTMRGVPGQKNKASFLIGGVGAGKSTFVSNLIVKYGFNFITEKDVVPLRIDVDKKLNHQMPDEGKEFSLLISLIFERLVSTYSKLETIIGWNVKTSDIYEGIGIDEKTNLSVCRENFFKLIKLLHKKTGKTPLIIIDNFDYLYHIYDRALFIGQAAPGDYSENQQILVNERNRCYDLRVDSKISLHF